MNEMSPRAKITKEMVIDAALKLQEDIMLGIGLNYIRFAIRELYLFRFLFQFGYAVENSFLEMIDSVELKPVLPVMQEAMGMGMEQTKKVF